MSINYPIHKQQSNLVNNTHAFNKENGKWTDGINMGPEINTDGFELAPYISPDNKYLFFTRRDKMNGQIP